jgi:hypothetical protein
MSMKHPLIPAAVVLASPVRLPPCCAQHRVRLEKCPADPPADAGASPDLMQLARNMESNCEGRPGRRAGDRPLNSDTMGSRARSSARGPDRGKAEGLRRGGVTVPTNSGQIGKQAGRLWAGGAQGDRGIPLPGPAGALGSSGARAPDRAITLGLIQQRRRSGKPERHSLWRGVSPASSSPHSRPAPNSAGML